MCVCVSQEHELDSAVRNSSVDSMRVELEELQREKVELDRKQRQLDLEMSSLNTHTTAQHLCLCNKCTCYAAQPISLTESKIYYRFYNTCDGLQSSKVNRNIRFLFFFT